MQYRPILSKAGNYTHKATEIMLSLRQKRQENSEPYDRDKFSLEVSFILQCVSLLNIPPFCKLW